MHRPGPRRRVGEPSARPRLPESRLGIRLTCSTDRAWTTGERGTWRKDPEALSNFGTRMETSGDQQKRLALTDHAAIADFCGG